VKKVLIIYHSQSGNTEAMANAVAEGARSAGATVTLKRAIEANDKDLLGCDVVAFGTPNYFAYMAGMVKDFFDRVWIIVRDKMANKPYVAFGSYGGGGMPGIESVEKICDGLGMKRLFDSIGVQRQPTAENLAECKELGKKIAQL
jgi:flavorubredoxin